jgi:DNA-binding response OmpR family regulator
MNWNNKISTCPSSPPGLACNADASQLLLVGPRASRRPNLLDSEEFRAPVLPAQQVLVLDDNVELAELLRLVFEMWGFQPTVAHFGREASRLLQQQQFRLAMVDVDLPDMTGFEVVAGALALGSLQKTKIIFCSGNPGLDRLAMARLFPGSLFVPKPFRMQTLLGLIRKLFADEPAHNVVAASSVHE